ncbi:MAG: PSD1 and planctomycete cytochrome C domain-containing protein [Verrucomicrobia bacterium]|nr:PSD1 and planctomycete cytochrome C domain-containing protein [Verrucomicrobiota bacterium]
MLRPTANAFLLAALLLGGTEVRGEAPDFNRDIRPILSENCFQCHGPDAKARKAHLRLDTLEGATTGGEFADPVVPGQADQSELIVRIRSDDPDELMPPPESKRSLTGKQKQLLHDWIASGANYSEHWAWIPPQRPDFPAVANTSLVANPIDAFLLRRLQAEGLTFSEPADPETLLRRLSLDLIGLPPTLDELREFKAALRRPEGEERAIESAVDRLLASPRFGERWARPWLDLARYADSNGFQADQLRPSWAYRDWVIDALNANMPYDRFTVEQLAGDLLPDATSPQKVATGFHRTVTCNVEAGVHPEENRYNQVVDRVNTTATTWLGITMECAQCHDHKFDPFSMQDYYSLFAFFNNTPLEVSAPSGTNDVSHDFIGPYLDLPLSPSEQKQAEGLDQELKEIKEKREAILANRASGLAEREEAATEALADAPQWETLQITSFQSNGGEDHRLLEDGSVLLDGNVPETARYIVECRSDLPTVTAIKLEALTHPELPGNGPGRGDTIRTNFVLNELEAITRTASGETPLEFFGADADFSQSGWEVSGLIDGNPKTGWAIASQFGQPHWATVKLAQAVPAGPDTTFVFTLEQNFGQGRTIGCLRLSAMSDSAGLGALPKDIATILRKPAAKRSKKEHGKLTAHFTKSNPELDALELELSRLTKRRAAIQPAQSLVMVEMEEPRKTFITNRGNYLAPLDEVHPATPALLPAPPTPPHNRLDLARWIVRRDNPLTARVAVNRWWAELFGNGIVATLEDFGTQAEPPTHPALLDWLAVEFMDSGWDMKHVLKTIVLSNAYRQSAKLTPELREKDPRNLLLARGPRFRMDAERIRDNGLAISGLLSEAMHGPPVMPYQPPGLWRQTGRNEPKWVEDKDEQRWRRGIYVVYRRAAPYPSMVNFDAPDRASCIVMRPRTNTPLQALTLLNDPASVEMAFALADRILTESPTPAARLTTAFQRTLSRDPTPAETKLLDELLQERLAHFRKDPPAARKILRNPTVYYKPTHPDQAELAAWFYLANTLLNLDETMTKP